MKKPENNDCCNCIYDGLECIGKVIAVNESTFDVTTDLSGAKMYNIPFDKFRYNGTETEIAKYDTIEKIVQQLKFCNYKCEAGILVNNVAFIALSRMS